MQTLHSSVTTDESTRTMSRLSDEIISILKSRGVEANSIFTCEKHTQPGKDYTKDYYSWALYTGTETTLFEASFAGLPIYEENVIEKIMGAFRKGLDFPEKV